MSKKIINIVFSCDSHECEYCGFTWENSTLIEFENWSYGSFANAYCFGNDNFHSDDCFYALFKYLGVVFDGTDNSDDEDFITFLEDLGYTVDIERHEIDEYPYNPNFDDEDYDD